MEWVEPFYTWQHGWLPDYAQAAVNEWHRAIAARIGRLATGPPGRVLELGAGGGQVVAAATADLGFDVVAVEAVARSSRIRIPDSLPHRRPQSFRNDSIGRKSGDGGRIATGRRMMAYQTRRGETVS